MCRMLFSGVLYWVEIVTDVSNFGNFVVHFCDHYVTILSTNVYWDKIFLLITICRIISADIFILLKSVKKSIVV